MYFVTKTQNDIQTLLLLLLFFKADGVLYSLCRVHANKKVRDQKLESRKHESNIPMHSHLSLFPFIPVHAKKGHIFNFKKRFLWWPRL